MKTSGILTVLIMVSIPLITQARPSMSGSSYTDSEAAPSAPKKTVKSGPIGFGSQGKFVLEVPLFDHSSAEITTENDEDENDLKVDSTASVYRVNLGYMIVPHLQVRAGFGLASQTYKVQDSDNEYESDGSTLSVGARYYFNVGDGVYPLVGGEYITTTETTPLDSDREIETETTAKSVGAGLLYALGGPSGGFMSAVISQQWKEQKAKFDGDEGPSVESSVFAFELAAGLYF